ncbi:DUF3320 domain-containing protein [Roseibacillus persicicus]|uniref:DUF3320 domain-containing protein n=1 Tax=Roseibacillus persicicus TaxID=454148 RepID=UPI00398BB53E
MILTLYQEDEVLSEQQVEVEVLAKNQWGGIGSMAELLPAFCMPNDPAVDHLLKATSEALRRSQQAGSIDGYQSKSRKRVWQLCAAAWLAVQEQNLSYALPPASFGNEGQKIRTPSRTLEGGVATCLETALLFAAIFEQANLNPLIVLTEGHAFVGVWLQPQEFPQPVVDDVSTVRTRLELKELIVFETTLATKEGRPSFSQALASGAAQLTDEDFQAVIDIRRSRLRQIRPLSSNGLSPLAREREALPLPVGGELEVPPADLPSFDVEMDVQPETASDRLDQWQRKLLDLTTRNRLLHVPERAKVIPLLCEDPAVLEDQLAAGDKIRLRGMPNLEAGGRDSELYREQNNESLQVALTRECAERGEILSSLDEKKLDTRLTEIYRQSKTDLKEGGANTLFLALGFLRWKKTPDDTRFYRAPLILVPVTLKRKSAASGISMTLHEDEPRFNLTLWELLRQDFELTLSGLDGDLPTDESGIDVSLIWKMVREATKEMVGFEVLPEVVLGNFSFAKFLMWKDLVERREQVLSNAVVSRLVNPEKDQELSTEGFPVDRELDQTTKPAEVFAPLAADSSQLAAVVASARDFHFVLDGPPGTGKSQTIANMIAHNLAMGRRVLFVAEKMAALEVVYRRLDAIGLADFCLEVHSNKTSKTEILKQLDRAWESSEELVVEEWQRETERLSHVRHELNQIVHLLHRRHSNGLTIYQAVGRVVRDWVPSIVPLDWNRPQPHTLEEYEELCSICRKLELNAEVLERTPAVFREISFDDYSSVWQEKIIARARDLEPSYRRLLDAYQKFLKVSALHREESELAQMASILPLGHLLLSAHGRNLAVAFDAKFAEKKESAKSLSVLLAQYQTCRAGLSTAYPPEVERTLDLAGYQMKLAEADKRFLFLGKMARKKVVKEFQAQTGTSVTTAIDRDLVVLLELSGLLAKIDPEVQALSSLDEVRGLGTDIVRLAEVFDLSEQIRSAIAALAETPEDLIAMRSAVKGLVLEANELLSPDGHVAMVLGHFEVAAQKQSAVQAEFCELAGISLGVTDFTTLQTLAQAILDNEVQLRAWTIWQEGANQAKGLGLQPLVDAVFERAVRSDTILAHFEVAYAKWFATRAINADETLRKFNPVEHQDLIEQFRKLDGQLAELTTRYIRAKLSSQIPSKNDVTRRSGYGVLQHELQKQRMHKPLRQLASEMGDVLTALAPCMLMSPLSIAQYLPVEQKLFDLVIFDEASQIAPWDAVGSIARGNHVVVAGDPRQMPPTNFFGRGNSSQDEGLANDMDSILDECLASGVPRQGLSWHYRSRHESLIAFSNLRYYEGKLITFPSAVTSDRAVSWRRVEGVYAKGKGRTNSAEAKALVAEVVTRLTDLSFTRENKSLAVITLNSDQQRLVEDLLDQARRDNPAIEPFFGDDCTEPVVVKNLETVQGDERDLILLGIGFGPTEPGGSMSMNFGPLNREGGWRRLNVALSRAREEMMIFTSFDSSDIDLNRTSARAVRDLKHFIEFAERGPEAFAMAVEGSVGGYESPFEEAVAAELINKGWEVVPQVGVSRFRIDLGIVHPDQRGNYLAGVECDGATYHSSATARDRDKVRQEVLSGLGWDLVRIWSTDWWYDKQNSLDKLHNQLSELLEQSREKSAEQETQEGESLSAEGVVDLSAMNLEETGNTDSERRVVPYEEAQLERFAEQISGERFKEKAYEPVLLSLTKELIEVESPISEKLLSKKISQSHGFGRTGRLIRERILEIAEQNYPNLEERVGGSFFWRTVEERDTLSVCRRPKEGQSSRSLDNISEVEILVAAEVCENFSDPSQVAKTLGIHRLSADHRERLEEILSAGRR